jgi:hypothetical protein
VNWNDVSQINIFRNSPVLTESDYGF